MARQLTASLLACGLTLACAPFLAGAPKPAETVPQSVVLRSQSGQFVVRGLPMGAAPVGHSPTSQVSYLRVDPALLAVSCDRIKQALLSELEMKDNWQGTITVTLHPVRDYDEPIDIISRRFRNGWAYNLHVPDWVERTRLVHAVVQVLLQEISTRRARDHAPELPPWLLDGITAILERASLSTLTLEPETWIMRQREKNADPLRQVRELLRARAPLTFNELNWPSEEQFTPENIDVYRACSQLFVCELLRLKNGPARLSQMLLTLPESLNWQTAFLTAYRSQFRSLLEVEKWWSLSVVHITSRDLMFSWTREQAFLQLDDALVVSAEVRLNAGELPMNAQVKLQQVIAEWAPSRQTAILMQKLNLLHNLRMRAPQEMMDLVDRYRTVLEHYVKNRRATGEGPFGRHPLSKDRVLAGETIKKLDGLDVQREVLRSSTNAVPAVAASR